MAASTRRCGGKRRGTKARGEGEGGGEKGRRMSASWSQVDEKTWRLGWMEKGGWRNFNEKEPTDCAGSSGRG